MTVCSKVCLNLTKEDVDNGLDSRAASPKHVWAETREISPKILQRCITVAHK